MPAFVSRAAARLLRTRWLVRAPIALYRRGLGWVFGQRLLLLEHHGRRSGLARFVVLEVLGRPDPGRFLVVAGFGPSAQWLQNVRADPDVRVSVGRRRRRPAVARELSRDDAHAALATYAQTRPRSWAVLRATMERGLGTDIDALPVVALDLR